MSSPQKVFGEIVVLEDVSHLFCSFSPLPCTPEGVKNPIC